jgi:hypothetical protein
MSHLSLAQRGEECPRFAEILGGNAALRRGVTDSVNDAYDHQLDLAAAYRSSVQSVLRAGGVAPKSQAYIANVSKYMQDYQPR